MEIDYDAKFNEILEIHERMVDFFKDEEDNHAVMAACLIFIANCYVASGFKPTELDEFWETARSLVMKGIRIFGKKSD